MTLTILLAAGLGLAQVNKPADPPKGAVQVEPGLWRHKDDKGKVWMYRRTPFGLAKFAPEAGDMAKSDKAEAEFITAVDGGDVVKFERKTPFGTSQWTRKKTQLQGAELEAWKRVSQPRRAEAKGKRAEGKQ
jgi:hypothetical protein